MLSMAYLHKFLDVVKLRFVVIDVKKTQKTLSGKKIKEQEVDIHNEIKIITASDEVYNL